MTRRLEELGAIPKATFERLLAHRFRPTEAQAKLGLERPRSSAAKLPQRYVTLALQAYAEELISEGDLAEYLETDRVTARGIYHAACQQPTGDEGDVLELSLDECPGYVEPDRLDMGTSLFADGVSVFSGFACT